jgi:hypothetical protein
MLCSNLVRPCLIRWPGFLPHIASTGHQSQHQAHWRHHRPWRSPCPILVTKSNRNSPLGATCYLTHGEPDPKLNSVDGALHTLVLRNNAVRQCWSSYVGKNPTLHSPNTVICGRKSVLRTKWTRWGKNFYRRGSGRSTPTVKPVSTTFFFDSVWQFAHHSRLPMLDLTRVRSRLLALPATTARTPLQQRRGDATRFIPFWALPGNGGWLFWVLENGRWSRVSGDGNMALGRVGARRSRELRGLRRASRTRWARSTRQSRSVRLEKMWKGMTRGSHESTKGDAVQEHTESGMQAPPIGHYDFAGEQMRGCDAGPACQRQRAQGVKSGLPAEGKKWGKWAECKIRPKCISFFFFYNFLIWIPRNFKLSILNSNLMVSFTILVHKLSTNLKNYNYIYIFFFVI